MTSGLNTQRFVKRPVEIKAVEFTGTTENHRYLDRFLGNTPHEHFDKYGYGFDPDIDPISGGCIQITTRDGKMSATVGDWIIEEPFATDDRRHYPCKREMFEKTYDFLGIVDDPDQLALF